MTERRPEGRLQASRRDEQTGLCIGTVQIGRQPLRVGIRPRAPGAAAARAPMLLFNGIGANLELAAPLMAALDGVETLIFDVPGAGGSPPPPWPYRLSTIARLAAALLDHLGYGEVDVMGVSWGGGLAQEFAIRYPRRVQRLVLAATSMGAPAMLPGHPRVLLNLLDPRRYIDAGHLRAIAPGLYGGDMRKDPQAVSLFVEHAHGGHPRGYHYQLLAMLGWTSLPWLWRITHPTLVMAGRDDPLVPLVNARLMAWLLRDARLHVIDDGHLFLLTRAAETARVISAFLGEKAPAA